MKLGVKVVIVELGNWGRGIGGHHHQQPLPPFDCCCRALGTTNFPLLLLLLLLFAVLKLQIVVQNPNPIFSSPTIARKKS